jgi:hypothetical protein
MTKQACSPNWRHCTAIYFFALGGIFTLLFSLFDSRMVEPSVHGLGQTITFVLALSAFTACLGVICKSFLLGVYPGVLVAGACLVNLIPGLFAVSKLTVGFSGAGICVILMMLWSLYRIYRDEPQLIDFAKLQQKIVFLPQLKQEVKSPSPRRATTLC